MESECCIKMREQMTPEVVDYIRAIVEKAIDNHASRLGGPHNP